VTFFYGGAENFVLSETLTKNWGTGQHSVISGCPKGCTDIAKSQRRGLTL
jgi:hypothetical protein